ncbi:MAG: hypothetical protein WD045_07690 [Pirellulaceae bacterium]
MFRLNMIGLAFVFVLGCGHKTSPSLVQSLPTMTAADAELELRERDSIIFQSWAGLHQGFDADTHLTFYPDGRVEIEYSGYDVERVSGRWMVSDDTIQLEAPLADLTQMPGADDWPPMQLRCGGGKLYLYPTRDTEALKYSDDTAWPLGELSLPQR